MQPLAHLSLTVTEDVLPRFCSLTGGGFAVLARAGCSVFDLLSGQLGISPDYLDRRIQTIFLNGRVVDDPRLATVPAGATIALSAAMPGIAGAMLRKSSPYATMRSQISHPNRDAEREAGRQDRLVIKLFNIVQAELGPAMLCRGIEIPGEALSALFGAAPEAFRAGILTARLDDTPIAPNELLGLNWQDQDLLLRVSS